MQLHESGSSLCAFVAPSDIDGELVRNRLSKKLPSYMVPTTIYSLERLSLNTNDKVDHKTIKATMGTLIAQAQQKTNRSGNYFPATPPASDTYISRPASRLASPVQTISRIWEDVLNLSAPPSLEDNFFDLGGNR